ATTCCASAGAANNRIAAPHVIDNFIDISASLSACVHDGPYQEPGAARYRAEQGVGFHPAASASFLKSELVVYTRVKYCGSSTLLRTVSQRSPLGSTFMSQYSVTTAFSP